MPTMNLTESGEFSINGDLAAQQEWVTRWNQRVYAGAVDRKGPQQHFVATTLGSSRNRIIGRIRG
jgi:hypothetical protein